MPIWKKVKAFRRRWFPTREEQVDELMDAIRAAGTVIPAGTTIVLVKTRLREVPPTETD